MYYLVKLPNRIFLARYVSNTKMYITGKVLEDISKKDESYVNIINMEYPFVEEEILDQDKSLEKLRKRVMINLL